MKITVLLLMLVACDTKQDKGEVYHGVDGIPSCSHDIVHQDRGTCVANGKRYRCIWTTRSDDVSRWIDVNCSKTLIW